MLPIALSLIGGGTVYLIGKIWSSGGQRSILEHGGAATPVPVTKPTAPPVTRAPTPPPVVKPAPVETKPPPTAPIPPPDTNATLPTPPPPKPVVVAPPVKEGPPLVERPIVAVPVAKPAPVELTPPPAPPQPPPDPVATLPTPERQWGPEIEVPVGDKYADFAAQQSSPVSLPVTPSKPSGTQPPAGFDGALASALASGLSKQIRTKQYDYDRAALKAFQTAAGLTPDGVYGNDSWGALLYFTSDAPRALYKPSEPTPYAWAQFVSQSAAPAYTAPSTPAPMPVVIAPAPQLAAPPMLAAPPEKAQVGPMPPAGFNPTQARSLAKGIAANIDTKQMSYDRARLKVFQTAAGIDADGIYGGGTRRALIFYGVPRPPAALFKPTATPPTYPWESQANAWNGA